MSTSERDFFSIVQDVDLSVSDTDLPEVIVGGRRYGIDLFAGEALRQDFQDAEDTVKMFGSFTEETIAAALVKVIDHPSSAIGSRQPVVVTGMGMFRSVRVGEKVEFANVGLLNGLRSLAGTVLGAVYGLSPYVRPEVIRAYDESDEQSEDFEAFDRAILWRSEASLLLDNVVISNDDVPDSTLEFLPHAVVPVHVASLQIHRAVPRLGAYGQS